MFCDRLSRAAHFKVTCTLKPNDCKVPLYKVFTIDFKLTSWFQSRLRLKMDASGANTLAWTRPVYLVKFKVTSRLLVDSHVLGWTQVRMDIPV